MVDNDSAILIVDDDEAICELVSEGLDEYGYTCESVSNANDATTKLYNYCFDMVLLDIRLPGKSGLDLLKIAQTSFEKTAIIMITAINNLDTAVKAMKLGASDYIVKPFTIDKLVVTINTVLENKTKRRPVHDAIQNMTNISYGTTVDAPSLSAINAIAFGVEAQVDYFNFHSEIVTKKTIDLAERLGLPANEINKWTIARDELYSNRNKYIKAALKKMERNPFVQRVLGLDRPVYDFFKSKEEQN